MQNELISFFSELVANPRQQLAHTAQPAAFMDEFGLSAQAQAVLSTGNPAHIVQAFSNPDMQPCDIFWDPGPDPLIDPDTPPPPQSNHRAVQVS